jgi:peptide/nickel transport system ATP-binding protein/oligopeptide transport system ATP-binding protein
MSDSSGVIATASDLIKIFRGSGGEVHALNGITFNLLQGKTLALVGESGSGKTTAARVLLGLSRPNSGEVTILSKKLFSLNYENTRKLRREIQVVQQDPFSQLNRRHSVERIIAGPLRAFGIGDKDSRRKKVIELLESVGLGKEYLSRRPHQLSGGQCQRVAIARALAVDPKIVVLDEAVSALDVSVRAQVLNLLRKIQSERGLTYLFITHDLGVAHYMADEIAVMFRGKIVEKGNREDIFSNARHHYTQGLLNSVPLAELSDRKKNHRDVSALQNVDLNDACAYRSRCPVGNLRLDCKNDNLIFSNFSETHAALCHAPIDRAESEYA